MPNIILFIADSWDGRMLSGRDPSLPVATPNADRLAARGTRYDQACCNNPICCPSRAILWSGQHTHRTGAWNNFTGLPIDDPNFKGSPPQLKNTVPDYPTLMTDLRRAGWDTNLCGTLDFTRGGHTVGARLSAWLRNSGLPLPILKGPRTSVAEERGERANPQDWEVTDAACDWLRERDGSRPFFLSVGVRCPHPFRTTSPYWLDQVDDSRITLPALEEDPHPATLDMRRARNLQTVPNDTPRRFLRRRYPAMIAEADAMLGQVLDTVEAAGLADDTWFIFAGDHGEMNLEHNLVFKSSFFEPSLRVPLIVAGPGVKADRVVATPVSLVDLYPTVAELANMPVGAELDGTSLAASLGGDDSGLPGEVFAQYHANDIATGGFMLRDDRWKYVRYPGYPDQLFDLAADPGELNNLAGTRTDVREAMERRLRTYVDPEAVDAEAKASDRAHFRAWRESVSREEYVEELSKLYGSWDAEKDAVVEAWLAADGSDGIGVLE